MGVTEQQSGVRIKFETDSFKHRLVCGVALLLCLLLNSQLPIFAQVQAKDTKPSNATYANIPSRAEVERAIELATGYLERACGPDGKFAYEVETGSGKESSSYDIIRHAGAIYALGMVNRYHPDPKAVGTMVRAAGFMRQKYMGPGVHPEQLVVWSKPLTEIRARQYAELGGAGLGLVALAEVRAVEPNAVSLEDLHALGRFLLFLQRNDGSFVHKYRLDSGPVANWEILYYPGEAVLGLIALYEIDHSPQWLDGAAKALSYLAKRRTGLSTFPADHWALIATAKLLRYSDQVRSTVSQEELVRHASQICDSIAREQFHGSAATGLDGAFDPLGRTAPVAARSEGLLAALEFLPKSELRHRIEAVVPRSIKFLLRAQVTSGPQAGGLPAAIVSRARDSSSIRIDYVQHALCAWVGFFALIEREPDARTS